MHKKHRIFFLLGLLGIFALFFLYLAYYHKYKLFAPKPPVLSINIPVADRPAFPNTFFYDFENINGLENLTAERSFSGQYALEVKGKRNATPPVQIPLDNNLEETGEAHFGAWICKADTSECLKGLLVFQIVDKSNKVKYSALSEVDDQTCGITSWIYVCGEAGWDTSKVLPGDLVKVYFWNNTDNTVYIDDIHVVFGRQFIRGHQSLADNFVIRSDTGMVKNLPPYPPVFFHQEITGNVKNKSVFSSNGKDSLALSATDTFCNGNYLGNSVNCEQILVIRKGVPLALLWYDKVNNQLRFVRMAPPTQAAIDKMSIYTTADIDGDNADELITYSDRKKPFVTVYKILARQPYIQLLESIDIRQNGLAADIIQMQPYKFGNKRNKSVILLDNTGVIHLLCVEKNSLSLRQWQKIPEANTAKYSGTIVCGHFIIGGTNDDVLLLYTEKKSGRCFYKIYCNKPEAGFKSRIEGAFDNKCDTLYPDNTYYVCDINNDGIDEVMSFFNRWRYDAKLVSFGNQGYVIHANIDFAGYPNDFNPKYFGKLSLVTGRFIEKNNTSIFLTCGHALSDDSLFACMTPYTGIFSYKKF